MPKSYEIILPLPPIELSPNARVHWATKSKMVKGYREYAWAEAKRAIGRNKAPKWKKATVKAIFKFNTKRRRDKDNFLAMLKPAFDGIKDAGIIEDDSGLTHEPVEFVDTLYIPCVVIEIKEA